jgi:hypothetical protein
MKTNKPDIRHLREWFKAMVAFQLSPEWISNPIRHRAARPKILGKETPREKLQNDIACLKWLIAKLEVQK